MNIVLERSEKSICPICCKDLKEVEDTSILTYKNKKIIVCSNHKGVLCEKQ